MQYLLTLYADEAGFQQMTKEQQQQGFAAYMAYTEALKQAGAFIGSNRLQPVATATTVRTADGKRRFSTVRMPTPKSSSAAIF